MPSSAQRMDASITRHNRDSGRLSGTRGPGPDNNDAPRRLGWGARISANYILEPYLMEALPSSFLTTILWMAAESDVWLCAILQCLGTRADRIIDPACIGVKLTILVRAKVTDRCRRKSTMVGVRSAVATLNTLATGGYQSNPPVKALDATTIASAAVP